jgi:hypothetical protein
LGKSSENKRSLQKEGERMKNKQETSGKKEIKRLGFISGLKNKEYLLCEIQGKIKKKVLITLATPDHVYYVREKDIIKFFCDEYVSFYKLFCSEIKWKETT